MPGGATEASLLESVQRRPVPLIPAGMDRPLDDTSFDILWDRDYLFAATGRKDWLSSEPVPLDGGKTIWMGHTPLFKINPSQTKPFHSEEWRLWAVDIGAGSGRGPLSLMDMDTKELWQAAV